MPEDYEDSDRPHWKRHDREDDDLAPRRRRDRDYDDEDRAPRRRRRDYDDLAPHRANLILALGLISIFICHPLGIAAWIMGASDLRAMREGRMDPEGESTTKGGMIIGIVMTALTAFAFIIVFMIAAITALAPMPKK